MCVAHACVDEHVGNAGFELNRSLSVKNLSQWQVQRWETSVAQDEFLVA